MKQIYLFIFGWIAWCCLWLCSIGWWICWLLETNLHNLRECMEGMDGNKATLRLEVKASHGGVQRERLFRILLFPGLIVFLQFCITSESLNQNQMKMLYTCSFISMDSCGFPPTSITYWGIYMPKWICWYQDALLCFASILLSTVAPSWRLLKNKDKSHQNGIQYATIWLSYN